MANDLYIHLKTTTAKNVCSEISEILSEQKKKMLLGGAYKEAARESFEYSKEVQAKFDEIERIAKIIADQKPKSFEPDSYYMNVMHVRFLSEVSVEKAKGEFEKIPNFVATRPDKFPVPGVEGFESADAEVHKRNSFEEPKEPCLGKKVCVGNCKACV